MNRSAIVVLVMSIFLLVPASAQAAPGLQVFGDSLAVGMDSYLRNNLSGWHVDTDARVGRPLAEGMAHYRSHSHPKVVAMSLFTNDDPQNLDALRAALRETWRDASDRQGCVVWATIWRPQLNYGDANRVIRNFAAQHPHNVRLVDWNAVVRANPSYVGPDNVHGTAQGYRWRGRAYANAAKSC
jgi:hypothetical protein